MSDDFYPFVDSGDPAPDNAHITGSPAQSGRGDIAASSAAEGEQVAYATRIAVYDDMLSTPRVIVIAPKDVRTYLEEITNTVYRCMKEQGGGISLMVIREIVENFIHANFVEPIISILDSGNTIRFADQGPGIEDKERAFEFGVTSADRDQKRYIRGTGAGFPMVQQYLENAGGAVSIEDNLHQGTVVTVSIDPSRVAQIERAGAHGGAVRGAAGAVHDALHSAVAGASPQVASGVGTGVADGFAAAGAVGLGAAADAGAVGDAAWGAGATGLARLAERTREPGWPAARGCPTSRPGDIHRPAHTALPERWGTRDRKGTRRKAGFLRAMPHRGIRRRNRLRHIPNRYLPDTRGFIHRARRARRVGRSTRTARADGSSPPPPGPRPACMCPSAVRRRCATCLSRAAAARPTWRTRWGRRRPRGRASSRRWRRTDS